MPSIYGAYTKEARLRLDYSITSQSIENNTTLITMDLYAEKTAHSGYNKTGKSYYNMTGKGNTTVNWDWGSSSTQYFLGSSTTTVAHNTDGTASTTLNGYWYLGNTTSYMPTELSVSGTITLPTIPRASGISLSTSNITLGQNLTITINRASTNFTHALYYQIDNGNWVVIASGVATTYNWNVEKSLANNFANSTSKTIRVICETYNGDTYIGSSSQNFVANISDDIKPNISSLTLSDTTNNSVYIETISKINAKTVASGVYGSTITSYSISMIINGTTKKTLYGNDVTFDLNNLNIDKNTSITITATVTDSRGKTSTISKSVTVYRYIKPYIISRETFRCDLNGDQDENGTYLSLNWNYHVQAVANNTASPLVRYRKKGNTAWTNVSLENNETKVIGNGEISTDYEYEVQYLIGDNFYANSTISITDTIPTGYTTVDYRAGGKGIAFGKVSEKDEFECNMIADFKKDISWDTVASVSNVDYNNYVKSGTYYLGTGCSNAPFNKSYVRLYVNGSKSSGDVSQLGICISSESRSSVYVRTKNTGVWGEWSEISRVITIAANTDFNTITNSGIYVCGSSPTGNNSPIATTGVLEVFKQGSIITQRFTTYNGRIVFQRGFHQSWTPWLVRSNGLMACVYPSQRLAIGGTEWVTYAISLASSKSNTSYGLLSASGGGIKIGKGVNTVNISASLSYYQLAIATEVDLQILKNGSAVVNIDSTCTEPNAVYSLTTNTCAINVVEGDLIQLGVIKGTSSNLTVVNDNAATSLTVQILC